jgi:hypothetical protein
VSALVSLTHRSQLTMGQLLCAFAYASDLAFGLQLEDSPRSCSTAVRPGLTPDQRLTACYTALQGADCTSWTIALTVAWHLRRWLRLRIARCRYTKRPKPDPQRRRLPSARLARAFAHRRDIAPRYVDRLLVSASGAELDQFGIFVEDR